MTNSQKNYIRAKAIEQRNKERILACNRNVPDTSGIYVLVRYDNGFKYAYIGQAKHLLTRLAQHLSGYQHIDLSIKKHGFYAEKTNATGWNILFTAFDECALDAAEQEYIQSWAAQGYQLYNHTTGSQGDGKRALGDAKSPKGYREGVAQGERSVIKKIAHWFDKHLKAVPKADKPSKNAIKALDLFNQLIQGESNND